ncbi:hypothetical protein ACFSTD_18310 [Novosphingobium colocasiae]
MKLETTGFYRVHYRKEGETWRIARLTAGSRRPVLAGQHRNDERPRPRPPRGCEAHLT